MVDAVGSRRKARTRTSPWYFGSRWMEEEEEEEEERMEEMAREERRTEGKSSAIQ